MSQCTCKHNETVEQDKPNVEPHNRRMARGIHVFNGQEKDEVIRLIQKADKQEKERLGTFMSQDGPTDPNLLFEGKGYTAWGMPTFTREPEDSLEEAPKEEDPEAHDFMWQKLAGVETADMEVFKATRSVKDKVIAALCQRYQQIRFDWSEEPDSSYLSQFLMINNARTKISASPLVEIFQAVSKISDESNALDTTCKVVVEKVSSLFD